MPDTDSPYRPPAAAIETPEALVVYEATGKFSIGRCVREAWASTLRNAVPFLGVGALASLAGLFFLVLVGAVAASSGGSLIPLTVMFVLLYLVFAPVLGWSMVRFSLNAIDGRARVRDAFAIFERFGSKVSQVIVLWLVYFALSLPGALPLFLLQAASSADIALVTLAQLWNIAWSVAISVRLFASMYFLVDWEMTAAEALRSSWSCTRGNTLRMLGLFCVAIGIVIAGMLAFIVGMIPASVVAWQLYASAFRQMVGRPAPATEAPGA